MPCRGRRPRRAPRQPRQNTPPLPPAPRSLASADDAGRAAVWCVRTRTIISSLDDVHLAATGAPAPRRAGGAVRAVAFAGPTADTLLLLTAPGVLAAWETRGGSVPWRREFGVDAGLASLSVDAADRRRVAAAGPATGHVVLLTLDSFKADGSDVAASSFRVGVVAATAGRPSPTLHTAFTPCGALALAVGREVTLYDPETGELGPAGGGVGGAGPITRVVAATRAASSPSFTDLLFTAHADGSLTVWRRPAGAPGYAASSFAPLAPRGTPVVAAAAAVAPATAAGGDTDSDDDGDRRGERLLAQGPRLVCVAATRGGAVTRLDAPLGPFSPSPRAPLALALAPTPCLVLHCPATRVTCVDTARGAIAVGTAGGALHLAAATRGGGGAALALTLGAALAAHPSPVRGVRWLGDGPWLVSFSGDAGARGSSAPPSPSTVLITDARSRATSPLPAPDGRPRPPVLGVAPSPGGRLLAVLVAGGSSELWRVRGTEGPTLLRVLDLPFAGADWLGAADRARDREPVAASPARRRRASAWSRSPVARASAAAAAAGRTTLEVALDLPSPPPPSDPDLPDDLLAFALTDGRVGVLAAHGASIRDARPRRPSWGLLGADAPPAALAGWGATVVLGDADGGLHAWDTESGGVRSWRGGGRGGVSRVALNPSSSSAARVLATFDNGAVGVWDVARDGVTLATPPSTLAALAGARCADAAWLPLPGGLACALVVASDGALLAVGVGASEGDAKAALAAGPLPPLPRPLASALLLPAAWSELLRLLVVAGAPDAALLSRLPAATAVAWSESAATRSVSCAAADVAYAAAWEGGDEGGTAAPTPSSPLLTLRPASGAPAPLLPRLQAAVELLGDARGRVLHAAEAAAMASAASPAARAAVAAAAAGDADEADFWGMVHETKDGDAFIASVVAAGDDRARSRAANPRPRGDAPSPAAAECDVLDAVSMGDLAAAVGLLLASGVGAPPASRFRSALAAVALASASGDSPPPPLLTQAAKVCAASFAAGGDALLPVPLLVAAGLRADAAAALADAGRWRLALTLACAAGGDDGARAPLLERWAAAGGARARGAARWRARSALLAARGRAGLAPDMPPDGAWVLLGGEEGAAPAWRAHAVAVVRGL